MISSSLIRLLLTLIVLISLYPISTYSQIKASGKVKPITPSLNIPLDPAVKVGKLSNGFTYYIRKNITPKGRAQLYLVNKVGSLLENENQLGLAHFVEHMGFNGTKNYPKNELIHHLQKAGVRFGADLNAHTSFDETVYELPIPTDNKKLFKEAIQIMRDWAQEVTFDPKEVDQERGVVLEELRLGKGWDERMRRKYLPLLLNDSHYSKRLPIGTENVLKNFNLATLRQFYQDWYRPNLQALIVVGDIQVKEVEKIIKDKFSDLKNPDQPRTPIHYTIPLTNKNQFITVTDKEYAHTRICIYNKYPTEKIKTTLDLRNNVIHLLYNQLFASRFAELTQQSIPPFLYAGSRIGKFYNGLDIAETYVMIKPGELENGFKAMLTEVERVKRFGFTQTELDRIKKSFMAYQKTVYKEKDKIDSKSFANDYMQHFLESKPYFTSEYKHNFYKSNIIGISLAEVNSMVNKYLTDINRDILLLAPEKDKDKLPQESTINNWISSVKQSVFTPYIDLVSNKPLLTTKPKGGKIISEKKDKALGTTKLILNNGVKIILKPTNFKNDEIILKAFSPGGTSLYSDSDFQSAEHAATIISKSGIAQFNPITLSKILADKHISGQPFITERTEGLTGSSNSKDFEIALQLTYLYFTQPRKDEEIFKSYVTQSQGLLNNRSDDPGNVAQDALAALLSNNHVRRTGPSVEKIEQIKLDRAYNIFKERFADASDFTFILVGNLNLKKIKPILEKYLGALPTINRKEEAKNLEIQIPTGKITQTIHKGIESKAGASVIFSGNYVYNQKNNTLLKALESILTIKLIERLREREGGVYTLQVGASYDKYPKEYYKFNISFECGPENVDKLLKATQEEINQIKQNGPQEIDVQKFLAEEKRTYENTLTENYFWLNYLVKQLENNEDPKEVLSYLHSLQKLNSQTLKEAANKYLSGDNLIHFILLPDKK